MIRFKCPACQKVLKVLDEGAGRKINCPKCGQRMRTPAPESAATADKAMLGQLAPSPASHPFPSSPVPSSPPSPELNGPNQETSEEKKVDGDAGAAQRRTAVFWLILSLVVMALGAYCYLDRIDLAIHWTGSEDEKSFNMMLYRAGQLPTAKAMNLAKIIELAGILATIVSLIVFFLSGLFIVLCSVRGKGQCP